MGKRFVAVMIASLALFFNQQGSAQQTPAEDEIVVTGRRAEELRALVSALSVEPRGEDQLARWSRRVCPGVIGATRVQAQYVIDRVAFRATAVGLETGEPGCRANIIVIFSRQADEVARRLAEEHKDFMAYYSDSDGNARGRVALADFVQTPRPVRWWHVARTLSTGGHELGIGANAASGSGALPNTVQSYSSSRLRSPTRQDFDRVVLVVDGTLVGDVRLGALADYIAMASLSQLAPDAEAPGVNSILNLFSGGDAPSAMTDWDTAYLSGLYAAPPGLYSREQARGIATAIERAPQ